MKKVVASMLAMLLVLSMGTTVFAFPSPNNQTALAELAKQWDSNVSDVSAYNSNNNIVSVTRTKPTTDQITRANSAAKQASKDAEVLGMTDLSVGKNVNTSKGIRLTFSVPGVKYTDKVYVLIDKSCNTASFLHFRYHMKRYRRLTAGFRSVYLYDSSFGNTAQPQCNIQT